MSSRPDLGRGWSTVRARLLVGLIIAAGTTVALAVYAYPMAFQAWFGVNPFEQGGALSRWVVAVTLAVGSIAPVAIAYALATSLMPLHTTKYLVVASAGNFAMVPVATIAFASMGFPWQVALGGSAALAAIGTITFLCVLVIVCRPLGRKVQGPSVMQDVRPTPGTECD